MKVKNFSIIIALIVLISSLGTTAVSAQPEQQVSVPADASNILGAQLPTGAERVDEDQIPQNFHQMLAKFVEAGGPGVKQGRVELLAWVGDNYRKTKGEQLMRETASNIKTAGWDYEIASQRNGMTIFSAIRQTPKKRATIGFWAEIKPDEANGRGVLLFAITEMLPEANSSGGGGDTPTTPKSTRSVPDDTGRGSISGTTSSGFSADATVFNLAASDNYVNVMGSQTPKMPAFQALPIKPGKARGYVKDAQGRPLEGAYIGVRSTAVGGFHSGAQVETDANGYYEIEVPWGATEFYAAGYTIDYGEGRAAMSLYPADGKANSFASANGTVENFVLVYHGLGDRNSLSEKPWDSTNYYGGAIRVSYSLGAAGDMWAAKGSLPENSEIEVTLEPEGELLDGTTGKPFVVRRKTGGINNFNINNIPVGRYRISARLVSGKPLKMRKTGYDYAPLFGLKPSEAVGAASILFVPSSAEPRSGHPSHSNWRPADVELQLP